MKNKMWHIPPTMADQARKIEFLRAENKRLLRAIDRLLNENRQLRSQDMAERQGVSK